MAKVQSLSFTATVVAADTLADHQPLGISGRDLFVLHSRLDTGHYSTVSERVLGRLLDYYPRKVTDTLLALLSTPAQRSLSLTKPVNVTQRGLRRVLAKFRCLKSLELTYLDIDFIHLVEMFRVKPMPNVRETLTCLSIKGCSNLQDHHVQALILTLGNLRELNLVGSVSITDSVFRMESPEPEHHSALQRGHPYNLVKVDLTNCSQISAIAVMDLMNICGHSLRGLYLEGTPVGTSRQDLEAPKYTFWTFWLNLFGVLGVPTQKGSEESKNAAATSRNSVYEECLYHDYTCPYCHESGFGYFKHRPRLQKLALPVCHQKPYRLFPKENLLANPHLTELTLTTMFIFTVDFIKCVLPNLQALSMLVTYPNKLYVKLLDEMFSTYNQLNSVDIKWFGEEPLGDSTFCSLFSDRAGLSKFKLDRTSITDCTLRSLSESSSQTLTDLKLHFCEMITDVGVRLLVTSCRGLQQLSLKNVFVSKTTVQLISQNLTGLRHLRISGSGDTSPELGDSELVSLALRLQNLENLCIKGTQDVTDVGLSALLTHGSKLRFLKCGHLPNVTADPFWLLVSDMEAFRHFKSSLLLESKLAQRHSEVCSTDEEDDAVVPPVRSACHAPCLRILKIHECPSVSFAQLSEVLTVCRGSLAAYKRHGQQLKPGIVSLGK